MERSEELREEGKRGEEERSEEKEGSSGIRRN